MYYCCEPERVAARGESDLILNARDCDRAGDVCMRMSWRCEPDARAGTGCMAESPDWR